MDDFAGRIGFITGGASGAGLAQAQVFGRAGMRIAIADVRADAVAAAVDRLRGEGIAAQGIVLDVTDRGAYAAAADEVERVFGGPPALLSNTAGVNSFGPVERTTYGDFDWVIGVNLGGVVNGMVTFVPRMIAAGAPGHVITVSSMGGLMGSPMAAPYSAAKAAVVNLMESYRLGLAPYGIGVSVVCPANIRTNIAEASKLRPPIFGESGFQADEATIASLQAIHAHGMDPLELAGHIKAGVEADRLYIIPYPEEAETLRRHFAAIVDAVPPMASDAAGARGRREALERWRADRARVFAEPKD